MLDEVTVEVKTSDKSTHACKFWKYRDEFVIVDTLSINGIEIDSIMNDREVFFVEDFDYDDFIDEFMN